MTKILQKPGCIRGALDVMGDKWTGVLLSELCGGPKSFGELETSAAGISPRTLSQRLEMLQQQEIITREAYCEKPKRCKYELTTKGGELKVILEAMATWSDKYKAC